MQSLRDQTALVAAPLYCWRPLEMDGTLGFGCRLFLHICSFLHLRQLVLQLPACADGAPHELSKRFALECQKSVSSLGNQSYF